MKKFIIHQYCKHSKEKNKTSFSLLTKIAVSVLSIIPFTVSSVFAYSDVPKGHWAEEYIQTASEKGIMRGVGGDTFGLGKPVKASEFITMLCKLMEFPVSETGGVWYEPYIQAAYSHNIIDDKNFNPDFYITRKEMAGMIIRALGFSDIETGKGPFSDTDDPYITSAYDFDIISGKSETIFSPDSLASREESAVMMCRLYNKYSQKLNCVHGFYAISSWNQRELASKMNSVSFGWSRLEYNDEVFLNTSSSNGNDWKIPEGSEEAISYFSEKNIPMNIAVIMNTEQKGENGEDACRTILLNSENRKKAIEQIVAASSDFSGVTIDFEGMKGAELKEGLNLFLTELRTSLSSDKTIYTAVHPVMDGEYYDGYDYSLIGKISDMVIIMAHDYGAASMNEAERSSGFTTTPVTPFNQIYTALKEAVKQIDKDKIALALSPASTSCWILDKDGKVINEYSEHPSQETVAKRLSQPDTIIEYSKKYRNPKAIYTNDDGNKTVLWYENSESIRDKILLARMFGINKISIWRIGQITNDVWATVENMKTP